MSATQTSRHVFVNGAMEPTIANRLQAFACATEALRAHGYTVTNPVELGVDNPLSKHACLRSDIAALLQCDTIALLPGWHQSGDAKLLTNIAARTGMTIAGVASLLHRDVGVAA